VDGTKMRKEIVQNIILDRCPDCGGVWLDHDELEALLRVAAEHSEEGFMNAVLLGLAW
jgi:Zn-finger nucleic acid-binding protein